MANYVLDVTRIPTGLAVATDDVASYRFCMTTTTPSDQHADVTPSLGGRVLGVVMDELDNAKVVAGGAVTVRVMGIAPIRLGTGGGNAGQRVISEVDGTAVTSVTTTLNSPGVLMQSGSAGSIVDVLLTPGALNAA